MKKKVIATNLLATGVLAFATSSYPISRNTSHTVGKANKEEIASNSHKYAQISKWDNNKDTTYNIAFYRNQELFSVQLKNEKVGKPILLSAHDYNIEKNTRYFTTSLMPEDVLISIPISPNMIFYSGLQSNANNSEWLFVERDMQSTAYNLCMYNHDSKRKIILFNQNSSPDKKYAFKPIAWSANSSTVYLEALVFGSSTENEGIWEYNLYSKVVKRLNITPNYSNTPQISADYKYFLYCATTNQKDVHVPSKKVLVFDIDSQKEFVIAEEENASFAMATWIKIPEKQK